MNVPPAKAGGFHETTEVVLSTIRSTVAYVWLAMFSPAMASTINANLKGKKNKHPLRPQRPAGHGDTLDGVPRRLKAWGLRIPYGRL